MPYARRSSFLEDMKQTWEAVQEDAVAKGKPPMDKAVWIRLWEDVGILLAGLWVRRCLRKKGAPEWVAYAVSTVDLTLTQIVVALRRHEQTVKKATSPAAELPDIRSVGDLFKHLGIIPGDERGNNDEQA